MTKTRALLVLLTLLVASASQAQSWISAYQKGLDEAKQGNWLQAREAFQQAVAFRPEDIANPTTLPGPVTEQRRWRNGSAYSPNFLAAYSAYRAGLGTSDAAQRTSLLRTAADEMETLVAKGQASREAFYYLTNIYTLTGETAKRQAIVSRYQDLGDRANWRVDTEVLAPEEITGMQGTQTGGNTGTTNPTRPPSTGTTTPITKPNTNTTVGTANPSVGLVAPLAHKYAIIIGNSEGRIENSALAFGADDAQQLREALITNAGYLDSNVDLVLNASSEQIRRSVSAMAERIPNGATIFLYFTGHGVNINGKDYLAGVDSEMGNDPAGMVPKSDVYQAFMSKGANVFAFFQVNRTITNGRYFGQEVPMVGSVAQVQATLPGDPVLATVRANGKSTGVFTNAVILALNEFKSNRVPILEFGWQVFYKVRRGESGTTGGGSRQTPTLPVLTNMASDARF